MHVVLRIVAAVSVASAALVASEGTGAAVTASMVAISDVAGCTADHQPRGSRTVANVVANLSGPLAVVGDEVQGLSTKLIDFRNCYDPAWGRFNSRARPVPGNHEYLTSGAAGYFDYFGSRAGTRGKGYYAYSVGDWKVLALNSNCGPIGGCGSGSPMYRWLADQLESSSARCQLAYFHHPRWSQGMHGGSSSVAPLYSLLYQHDVEILLSGHDHAYQRFPALNPSGQRDPDGVVQFVLPPGGSHFYSFTNKGPSPVVRNNNTFGALALTLRADGWSSRFVPEPGRSFSDTANGTCDD
jgi:hypothetical protein